MSTNISRGYGLAVRPAVLVALALYLGCSPSPATPDDAPLTAPFVISDHFAPTGYMGDGEVNGLVTMDNDACPTRAPGAVGDCYKVVYTPAGTWAGIYWQYPANNWGAKPGRKILPGAKR